MIALVAIAYSREHRPPASRDAGSLRVFPARRTVVGYRSPAALLICPDVSFRAEFKRRAMAMEYSRRGCRSRLMGRLYIPAADVPGALQFFKDLWRAECSDRPPDVALYDRRGHLYWRRGEL